MADEALWSLLKGGGQVILIRHALTTPGVGDPEGMKLGDCSTQRNLNDEGRAHARQLGEAFRTRGVTVRRVLSSPWCRCTETARLAFGKTPELLPALGNLFGRSELAARQVAELKPLVSQLPAGGNTVLVFARLHHSGADWHFTRHGGDGGAHAPRRRALHRRRAADRSQALTRESLGEPPLCRA
ncbi:histidine phosphatase family protein [Polaromonas sp. P2-4]|nr:histidine phosphatase family protein [Polaromonas sp. P2-4]